MHQRHILSIIDPVSLRDSVALMEFQWIVVVGARHKSFCSRLTVAEKKQVLHWEKGAGRGGGRITLIKSWASTNDKLALLVSRTLDKEVVKWRSDKEVMKSPPCHRSYGVRQGWNRSTNDWKPKRSTFPPRMISKHESRIRIISWYKSFMPLNVNTPVCSPFPMTSCRLLAIVRMMRYFTR